MIKFFRHFIYQKFKHKVAKPVGTNGSNVGSVEEEVEDTIRNPMKSLRKTPDRIVKSVKEVGSFVNKSAKKISNLRKNR